MSQRIDSRLLGATALAVALLAGFEGAAAQGSSPVRVPGAAGEAIYVNQAHKDGNDTYGYAGAFRAGDFVFVSGVVAGAWGGETLDDEALKATVRAAFEEAGRVLEAAGASYDHVVDIITFHVWDSPYYAGDKASQLAAVVDVRREFMREPDPAWTAVGTTELVPDHGIVEIRLTAHVPPAAEGGR